MKLSGSRRRFFTEKILKHQTQVPSDALMLDYRITNLWVGHVLILVLLLRNFARSGGVGLQSSEGNCNKVRETSNIVLHGGRELY